MIQRTPCAGWSRRYSSLFFGATLSAALTLAHPAAAATVIWSGANTNVSYDWSESANWAGDASPGVTDDVKFFDAGAVGTVFSLNNTVDAVFPGTIASLQYGQTNNLHTTYIAEGKTLLVNGSGGIRIGSTGDPGVVKTLTNVITGPGTLRLNNSSASLVLNQGGAANGRAILDMSGLNTFVMTGSRIGIGTTLLPNPGNAAQRLSGILFLARTNEISLSQSASANTYATSAGQAPAIELSHNPGNNAGMLSVLFLGQSNAFFIDSISAGRTKASASAAGVVMFNPAFISENPVAHFRGIGGPSSRVTWWSIGDMCNSASSAQVSVGTNNFTGGTVDAMVDTLSLARDTSSSHSATATIFGVLTFNAGTINANTIFAGNQSLGPIGSITPLSGIINVNGDATLIVNSNLVLGHTTQNSVAATQTVGTVIATGGSIFANQIRVGAASANNSIRLTNATLIVTNTLSTNASGLATFIASDSTIGLSVQANGSASALVRTLTTAGSANLIRLGSTPVLFNSYPQQIPLIKFTTWNGENNFALDTLPEWAVGATLVSNGANSSLDLLFPSDPRPVITTQPLNFAGGPGSTASFTVEIDPNSVQPLSFQWFKGATLLNDGASGNGSTYAGTTTDTLTINNAQVADSGDYFVIVSNAYGSATNSPGAVLTISDGEIAPSVTGPASQTVIEGNDATFSASVSGLPVPTLKWYRDGVEIPGATTSTYTLTDVNYLADNGAVFSIVASNSAGVVSNSAALTVIVPPAISQQPADLIVTNSQSASFTVVASGVPDLSYQWRKNGNPIPNATNATLSFASAAPSDMGVYSVVITNAAGTLTSSNATLTVNSVMSVVSVNPALNATDVRYDTPLKITFSRQPVLRNAGRIRIFDLANPSTPVDTIDLTLNNGSGAQAHSLFPGDAQSFNYYPVIISGNTATIYPHGNVMTSNKTYYVTIDNGVFADTTGAYFAGITNSSDWQFSTKPTGPVDPQNPVVAADGTGDFVTVQGAVDSLPVAGASRRTIHIRNGDYFEIVNISGKTNITLRGESRTGTIIRYPNNANLAPGGTTHARMTFKVNANDIALENLTITNSTPQGGGQAEALMISNGRRCIVFNCELYSRQDTILANISASQAYFYQTKIVGNFDYIWGGGNLYFEDCDIQTISGANNFNITAARTETSGALSATTPWINPNGITYSANGFSFVRCRFTSAPGASGITLAGSNGTAGGLVSWAFCSFDSATYTTPSIALSNNYVFWQHQNTTLASAPLSFANVQTIGVTNNDPRLLAATNLTTWFYGWTPALAPNILTNPASQAVTVGDEAVFTVTATGIPEPTYQWLKNGTNLIGETGSTLIIPSAQSDDAGDYSVEVSTPAGSVTSATATLTVNTSDNTAPVFSAPAAESVFTINPGVSLSVTNVASDADLPAQTLTFSLLSAPTNAVLNSEGVLTWRPLLSQSDTTNVITIVVTDDGSPNLSAMNSYSIVVNPLTLPTLGSIASSSGAFSFTIDGQTGPDYAVQVSTNLATGDWITILSTNSPAMPFDFTDIDVDADAPVKFYRVLVGPPLP